MLYPMGSYVFIEFPKEITPNFNKYGIIECEQNDIYALCEIEFERRIKILTN